MMLCVQGGGVGWNVRTSKTGHVLRTAGDDGGRAVRGGGALKCLSCGNKRDVARRAGVSMSDAPLYHSHTLTPPHPHNHTTQALDTRSGTIFSASRRRHGGWLVFPGALACRGSSPLIPGGPTKGPTVSSSSHVVLGRGASRWVLPPPRLGWQGLLEQDHGLQRCVVLGVGCGCVVLPGLSVARPRFPSPPHD
jgi:hypothetical protein